MDEYQPLREQVTEAIRNAWFDPKTGSFAGGVQGADAFAVWAGLAGGETAVRLAKRYDTLGHCDTGFLGTDILMEVLCEHGHIDTALKLLESEAPGSFLYQKRRGATTLWETWTGGPIPPMFGACVRQLFSAILGIPQSPDSAGYHDLHIAPRIPKNLPWAKGSLTIPTGEVSVSWVQDAHQIRFQIGLPPNTVPMFSYHGHARLITQTHTLFPVDDGDPVWQDSPIY